MADSAEFVFSDEQRELRAAVRRFAADQSDEQVVRRLMESDPGFDPKAWARLGGELGVLGLSVPEELGGVGGTLVDQAVAVEELGAALFCGPLFGTVMLAIPALVAAGDEQLLPALVEGTRTAAFAVGDRGGAFDPADVSVRATADGVLSGTVERVVDAAAADDLLVAATGPDGVGLYAVDAAAAATQARRTQLTTLDSTRRQATVALDGAVGRPVAGPDSAQRVITHALQVGAALLAAEQVGGAQHLLDLSVEYAKGRLQFGRPIGSFQAVKHTLADMLVEVEHARSAAYHAAWALGDGSDDPALAASIAQATASRAFAGVATDTIQVHGGIGFTWEYQAQLYYKRAVTDAALLGSAEQHRGRIARLVLDTASADGAPWVATGTE
ncbi:acyl-CoA dehydrogenase family protein [Pseudonocardia oroxyli]|uniref:Acyl-CoA dehydrogenase n=1 Tax=Pseudonocardia oroxyli TaxID=366584 RepID=A0A1G7DXV6_PSEOR|nr:acyl-CoA dehydrogenase family protein [Pseudonocardia oroxyli]SDE55986.1 Acyl-CoA dehydrogenase [Pseudonocardia oroxyli]